MDRNSAPDYQEESVRQTRFPSTRGASVVTDPGLRAGGEKLGRYRRIRLVRSSTLLQPSAWRNEQEPLIPRSTRSYTSLRDLVHG
jgi:hypothetical protein